MKKKAKKFCVMTVGRSGSTALMECLNQYQDIALPSRDVDCKDEELLHPENSAVYLEHYAGLCKKPGAELRELVDLFYRHHQNEPYAGFKSMPDRHPDFPEFVARPDIRFIGLIRRDIPSTVASFMVALERSSWRRHGEPHPEKWKFDRERHGQRALGNLAYILNGHAALMKMPDVIRLTYEDLCTPGFSSPQLDEFFGREIRIANPRPPTHGSSYVENWEEFVSFLQQGLNSMRGGRNGNGGRRPTKSLKTQPKPQARSSSLADIQGDVEQYLNFIERTRSDAAKHAGVFRDLKSYCMFIGYPRSGHSIVGSFLDAHPNIVMAQELDALRCLSAGMDRLTIFHLLLQNAQQFTQQGRVWNGYNYQVPNQWQGRFEKLEVIGDKKGGRTSVQLLRHPELLDHFRRVVGLPVRFVHVIRNPYDNIATLSVKHGMPLEAAVQTYFDMTGSVLSLKNRIPAEDIFDMRHEDLITDASGLVGKLCGFLGQEAQEGYLKDCASIVYAKPHQSRMDIEWTESLKQQVQKRIEEVPFLSGYDFEN